MADTRKTAIDPAKVRKACLALYKIAKAGADTVVDVDSEKQVGRSRAIKVSILFRSQVSKFNKLTPRKVKIPNGFIYQDWMTCCLIGKDPAANLEKAVQSDATLSKIVSRVISLSQLKKECSNYEAKRRFRDEFDIFLVDERLSGLLPNVFGKAMYKHTKYKIPIPIQIERSVKVSKLKRIEKLLSSQPIKQPILDASKDSARISIEKLTHEIKKAFSSAFIMLTTSKTISSQISDASTLNCDQTIENVNAFINNISNNKILRNDIREIHVKLQNSVALPVYLDPTDYISADATKDQKA